MDLELERLWMAVSSVEWRSLALVPASGGLPTVELARTLSSLGFRNYGESIGVADLTDVRCNLEAPIEVIRWHVRRGERVIVAVGPCGRSVATVPLVRAVDCAILCIALGRTRIDEANDTIARLGRDAFLGTLLVRPERALAPVPDPVLTRRLGAFS